MLRTGFHGGEAKNLLQPRTGELELKNDLNFKSQSAITKNVMHRR